MHHIRVRPAVAGDVTGLVGSNAALFAEDGAARDRLRDRQWPAQHGEQWCAHLLDDPASLVLVATNAEEIVGHLIGSLSVASAMWVAPRAELVSMYVKGDYRGQGLGSQLVGGFKDWAKLCGAARLHVTAYVANEHAVRFYTRHGFTSLSVELAADT